MSSADDFLLKHGICRVKGRCYCPDRQTFQRAGDFFYAPALNGYVFADRAGIRRRDDNRPFVWHDCPWCGGTLLEDDEQ